MVVAAALAAPPAGAATWSPVNDATDAGGVRARGGGGRRRPLHHRLRAPPGRPHRAEVRRGLLGGRLRGDSVVLDSSGEDLSSVALTQAAGGLLAAAWLRHEDRAQGRAPRPCARTARSAPGEPRARRHRVRVRPRWVVGWPGAHAGLGSPGRLRVREAGRVVRPAEPASGAGLTSQVSVVVERSGARVAVWSGGTRVVAATAPAGGPFGAPSRSRAPAWRATRSSTLSADGLAVAAWVRNEGAGNAWRSPHGRPAGASLRRSRCRTR